MNSVRGGPERSVIHGLKEECGGQCDWNKASKGRGVVGDTARGIKGNWGALWAI